MYFSPQTVARSAQLQHSNLPGFFFCFSCPTSRTIFSDAQSSSDCTGNRNNIIVNFPRFLFFSFSIFCFQNGTCRGSISFACPIRFFHKEKKKQNTHAGMRWVRVERTFFPFPQRHETFFVRTDIFGKKKNEMSYPCLKAFPISCIFAVAGI